MNDIEEDQLENELMPNTSEAIPGIWQPETEEEQTQEENKERATIANAIPLMEELMAWFEEQILVVDSVAQVKATQKQTGMTLQESLNAHDIVRDILVEKRLSLQSRYEQFMDRREEEE